MALELHWFIPIIVGIVLGALIPYLVKLVLFLIRRFRTFFLEGQWYAYYYVYEDGEPVLKRDIWNINKGILNHLAIVAKTLNADPISFPQRYKGKVTKEQNLFTVVLRPTTHTEEILIRFKGTYNVNQKVLLGLWSGIDLDGYACVGPQIISRYELPENEIHKITQKIETESEQRLMKIS